MVANKYLDSSVQKAFLPTVPGCTEHHLKLSSILAEAHSNHKSVAVCWLDLANAYGSVHHPLIDFSLRHYYAPLQFLATVKDLYTSLSAKVITADWETPVIPLQKGVYKGDPLSVVIFNTVMNTLLDTISPWATGFPTLPVGLTSCSMPMILASWLTPRLPTNIC